MRTRSVLRVLAVLLIVGLGIRAQSNVAHGAAPHSTASLTTAEEPPGIVLLVRRPQHVRAALQTVRDLETSATLDTVPVEVVVCGKAVQALRSGESLASHIAEQAPDRVQVLACGMSIENLGVERDALSPVVDIVPNGLAHALKQKAAGYLSVDL